MKVYVEYHAMACFEAASEAEARAILAKARQEPCGLELLRAADQELFSPLTVTCTDDGGNMLWEEDADEEDAQHG